MNRYSLQVTTLLQPGRSTQPSCRAMRHAQIGSVYLGYALLAFILMICGVLLLPVHKAFAFLVLVGVIVFFFPNLMALMQWCSSEWRFVRKLAAHRRGQRGSAVVVTNEFHGRDAQALWLDPASRELGLMTAEDSVRPQSLDTLQNMRAVRVEERFADSFHEGRIRIPAFYTLVFEFKDGHAMKLVTRKRQRLDRWIKALHPHIGEIPCLEELDDQH